MASYEEIYDVGQQRVEDQGFSHKVVVALVDVANDVQQEDGETPNHARRLVWAAQTLGDPKARLQGALYGVLIANKGEAILDILNASDAQIKTAVEALVDLFAGVE